ncbi:enoyl-CoA hydratase [Fulvitalea axinellae]|uniref:Enoyl-CoA hydratase n=1 Tax=Fulvitalea axinellae TaxID=1182444 RepID=A0AAU9D563_9BACT|nr:enoyl-CoA hydratase [Fulvitalea axinellae]
MAESGCIKIDTSNQIMTIAFDRQDKLNALSVSVLDVLRERIEEVYDDNDIKGVIITGEGSKAFSSGVDIDEISTLNELNARKFSEKGQEIMNLIENCHKPVIAAIDGYASGAGCELAMCCHLRVATEHSKFGFPEANVGIIPGFGGTQRLPRLVGKGKALELLLTGDYISAQEAKITGLVNYLVSDREELLFKCKNVLDKVIAKAPLAIGMLINCVNASFGNQEGGYQTEANSFSNCSKSQDFKEGITAFVDKREPNFIGE